MPIEPFELVKLIFGIIIVIIPGYLWSFIFSKKLTCLERLIFGFMLGLGFLTCATFILNIFLEIKITQTLIFNLYAFYAIPVFILYGLSVYRFGIPKIQYKPINIKYVWLLAIIAFAFFMMFLPHLFNNYYLPFHVDEWLHWSYSKAVIESGQSTFINPYTGGGIIANPEIGFHISTSCLKWISGSNLLTIFLFMPSIIGVLMSLTAFNIGERSKKKFGLEAAFLIAFIPTTCRLLGPSFYVAVTLGLLILVFVIWLVELRKIQAVLFISAFILFMFIVHPVTAFAGIVILLVYSVFLVFEKKYKIAFLTILFSIIPVLIIYILSTRWSFLMDIFVDALYGTEYIANLPPIWVTFEYLGVLTWVLFILGAYFCFTRGDSLKRAFILSAIVFIGLIGLYHLFDYGLPIIYDRAFLYLFVLVTLVAAVGLSELRRLIVEIKENQRLNRYIKNLKNLESSIPIAIGIVIVLIAMSAHMGIGYYELISEEDYETFVWINDNIEYFRDVNHSYDRGAVHPFKASPFSAITGLYIIASNMHPIHGNEKLWTKMEGFTRDGCLDTSFLERYKLGVVYGNCANSNLTMVYPGVYLYPGLYEDDIVLNPGTIS